MQKKSKTNLENAFSGESQAHMKYLAFSSIAQKEGKINISRLFRAVSFAEEVHAINHLKALAKLGKTIDNLESAIKGEDFEVLEMYPAYILDAKEENEKEAEKTCFYAIEAEKIHAKMYRQAKEAALTDKDLQVGDIFVCPVCGFTAENDAPEICPVCGAKKKSFKQF